MAPLGRVVAIVLAVLIGGTLALYEPNSGSSPPPSPSPSAAASADAVDPEFSTLLDMLAERARDGIRRHGDFRLIVVGLGQDGSLQIAEDAHGPLDELSPGPMAHPSPSDDALAPNLRAIHQRIERGEMRAYGWAQTVHAPGERRPDGVFFEIVYGGGQIKRREMTFSYNVGGRLDFYPPGPVSRRPGAPFVEPPSASPGITAPNSGGPVPNSSATSTRSIPAVEFERVRLEQRDRTTPSPAGGTSTP